MLKKLLSLFLIAGLLLSPVCSFADTWGQNQKPVLGSQIDFSHPLSRGLVGCWLMNEGGGNLISDLTKKHILGNYPDNPLPTFYRNGLYFTDNGNTVDNDVASNNSLSVSTNFTIIWAGSIDSVPGGSFHTGALFNANSGSTIEFKANTDGNVYLVIDSGSSWQYASSCSFNLKEHYMFSIVASRTKNEMKFYKNLTLNTTSGVGFLSNISMGGFRIGRGGYDNYYGYTGLLRFIYIYSRALSPQEIQQLYIEPYCFIKQDYRLYYTAPAATTYFPPMINIF